MNGTPPPTLSPDLSAQPTQQEISRRAQELWEQYGRPSGRDEAIWLEAEHSLQAAPVAPTDGEEKLPAPPATNTPAGARSPAATALPKTTSVRPPRSSTQREPTRLPKASAVSPMP